MAEWNTYVSEQREKELAKIIQEEKLKEPETRKYLANAFRDVRSRPWAPILTS
mgnify:CR=1 FL=1